MAQIRTLRCALLIALVSVPCFSPAVADAGGRANPCGVAQDEYASHGLIPVLSDTIIYDSNQGLCWLADANLAGDPGARARVTLASTNPDGSTPAINPDGTMDYETALNWVAALNSYNNGKGWLGHSNWQLPATPLNDTTCTQYNNGNFGVQCTGSAMANLYRVGLSRAYPDSVLPQFLSLVWPLFNLQPGLYWTATPGNGDPNGVTTFSFNTGVHGANTFKYNYFHILPMSKSSLGPIPKGSGVLPYWVGPAAGKALYDSNTGLSWTLDANLPALFNFGVTGKVTITSNSNGSTLTVPLVDKDGAVYFSAVDPTNSDVSSSWVGAMNKSSYAGTSGWVLPGVNDLQQLYKDLGLQPGDWRLAWWGFVGPFLHLQPGFYWSCQRDDGTSPQALQAPCDPGLSLPTGPHGNTVLQYSFNFDDGFVGTDLPDKLFYVMVYYPAPSAVQ